MRERQDIIAKAVVCEALRGGDVLAAEADVKAEAYALQQNAGIPLLTAMRFAAIVETSPMTSDRRAHFVANSPAWVWRHYDGDWKAAIQALPRRLGSACGRQW